MSTTAKGAETEKDAIALFRNHAFTGA